MQIIDEKRALREKIQQKVAALSKDYTDSADKLICEAVIKTDEYQKAKTVFCFVGRSNEINTYPIMEDALVSGKRLCTPKCVAKGVMEARQITSFDELADAKFGLLEPLDSCKIIMPDEIEFVVVPCSACNLSGQRLGFGGGFYDRYLNSSDFFTCMICRHELICETIPIEEHDFVPDMVITESAASRL